ncbi:hypothetical protein [Streptomyces chiangmaiensis]|uniref:Fucose isomerase n=1 Tax=Streptomyces chiangmaiensis TaxID=766497 RepID=A0ABU7FPS8_9ACTN|nr:hypothetical protein [Streptomyces chiangmaiensis]MED7826140.1 hypothetical protein [Streptomyces chiangmaiensis]
MPYALPQPRPVPSAEPGVVYTVASGDLRESANVTGWPSQAKLEADLAAAVTNMGRQVRRGHPVDEAKGHGFIDSQRADIEVFKQLPPEAPLIVVEGVWQYSHHVLAGLRSHRGPILVVANWSGEFPGLVGLLNLTASLTKANVPYSALWSEDFTDQWARDGLRTWLTTGTLGHDTGHVRDLPALPADAETELGTALARQLQSDKAVIGVFDEGCMGMYNAIIDDELLNPLGIYKERLSQSTLVVEMNKVTDGKAQAVRDWLDAAGMVFHTGTDEATELTDAQLLSQFRMYIAALRIADDFGLDAVGIQYQQGLKDTVPASDLAEGLLNNVERPAVLSRDGARELYAGPRSRTSTRWMREWPWTPWSPTGSGRPWASTPRRPCTNPLGTGVRGTLRVGLRDIRLRAGVPSWRLRQVLVDASAADVLPAGWRHPQRRLQAGGDRLVTRVHHGRRAARRPRTGHGGRAPRGGDPAASGGHDAAVAHHACRSARSVARSVHGTPQGEPPERRLRPRRRHCGQGTAGQGRHAQRPRPACPPVR